MTLAAIWAILILQRADNNIARSVTIDAAGEEQLRLASAAAHKPSSSRLTGLHIVITAAGEPGDCASLVSWRGAGLYAGQFTHEVQTCGVIAQHSFACSDCIVNSASVLEAVLPWSCQSLFLQAIAVGEDGELSTRNASATAPAPGPNGDPTLVQLLASVDADVPPMLLLQNDTTQKGFPKTRGYRLLGGGVSQTTRTVEVDGFTPATATVRVSVKLAPSGIYQAIQLSERITLAQLLASLTGILGLLGAFGAIAKQLERPLLKYLPHAGFDPASAAAAAAAEGGAGSSAASALRPAGAEAVEGRDGLWSYASPLAAQSVRVVSPLHARGDRDRDPSAAAGAGGASSRGARIMAHTDESSSVDMDADIMSSSPPARHGGAMGSGNAGGNGAAAELLSFAPRKAGGQG